MKYPADFGRRQALKLTGAALVSGAAFPLASCTGDSGLHLWEGEALGAPASIKLFGLSEARAEHLFKIARKETERLAKIFSLYDSNSEISRLNRTGRLKNASRDMIELLHASRHISELTGGAFDVTVQPLWNLSVLMQNIEITKKGADDLWNNARALVDYHYVSVDGHDISFAKQGVEITLNGIAQGYISDKVAAILQDEGAENGLVNIGEFKAFGRREGGEPWRVGIQDPRNIMDEIETLELRDQGLATSSGLAGKISDDLLHIFDTRADGLSGSRPEFISASAVHKSAMVADGFATAFTLMNELQITDICNQIGGMRAILVREDGEVIRI